MRPAPELLFIDDTVGHVTAGQEAGATGVH